MQNKMSDTLYSETLQFAVREKNCKTLELNPKNVEQSTQDGVMKKFKKTSHYFPVCWVFPVI